MPKPAPTLVNAAAPALSLLGLGIRTHRKSLGVSANAAAQAAGLSRVTLHRIEHGVASVTMGAYLNAMAALGLEMALVNPLAKPLASPLTKPEPPSRPTQPIPSVAGPRSTAPVPPLHIRVADFPQLQALAWQMPVDTLLSPAEALGLYERNWRHVAPDRMTLSERSLLDSLVSTVGRGQLLV